MLPIDWNGKPTKLKGRPMNTWLKRRIFDHHILIATVAILALLAVAIYCVVASRPCELTLLITVAGGIASFVFFIQKQQLDELRVFTELFRTFNERYDGMDQEMNDLRAVTGDAQLSKEEDRTLNRYFNLCGEEHLYYRKGYIFPEVWEAWHNGMKDFLNKSTRIQRKWSDEKKSGSYYGLDI
jgi:hypothetical protein